MALAKISPTAFADLEEIHSYIADDDPEIADRFIDKILTRIRMLANTSEGGRIWRSDPIELRIFPFQRYLIFYNKADFGIRIFRVLHSARDLKAIADEGGFN